MAHKVGPKEQQRIDLRLKRYQERGPGAKRTTTEAQASKPIIAPVQASAPTKETTVKKKTKKADKPKAKKRSVGEAAANLKAAKAKAPRAAKSKKNGTVPALDVANFMAREGGASMAELVEKFGIEAHPMRAKVHYIRNQIAGWQVETKDGRYYATAPKAA